MVPSQLVVTFSTAREVGADDCSTSDAQVCRTVGQFGDWPAFVLSCGMISCETFRLCAFR